MKIKKTYQGVIPNNKIVNTSSTSKTDTYSCDYINKLHSYSTEEQVIGKWIDGKLLYRCVLDINVSSPTTDTWYYVNNIPDNIEKITKIEGSTIVTSGDVYPFNYALSIYVFPCSNGTISNFQYKVSQTKLSKIFIIFEYTKTTDTEEV